VALIRRFLGSLPPGLRLRELPLLASFRHFFIRSIGIQLNWKKKRNKWTLSNQSRFPIGMEKARKRTKIVADNVKLETLPLALAESGGQAWVMSQGTKRLSLATFRAGAIFCEAPCPKTQFHGMLPFSCLAVSVFTA